MGIWEYIWQWANRIIQRTTNDVGETYTRLQFHGVETYILTKLTGAVQLIPQHLNQTHRDLNTTNGSVTYNFNTLGLIRHAIPQYTKEGALKGATITLITNGGTFSTLEFLSNVQAASNALQRLTEQKTACDPEQCPPEPLTKSNNNPDNAQLVGMDFLQDLALGRLLIKAEQTPSHARASLNQGASFLSARAIQTASELKPLLKSIVKNPPRGNFQSAKACDLLVDVAEKANLTPEEFAKLQSKKKEPKTTTDISQDAKNMFSQRTTSMVIGRKITTPPKTFPQTQHKPEPATTMSAPKSTGNLFGKPPRTSMRSRDSSIGPSEGSSKGKTKGKKDGHRKANNPENLTNVTGTHTIGLGRVGGKDGSRRKRTN